jgi:hypothetical protein
VDAAASPPARSVAPTATMPCVATHASTTRFSLKPPIAPPTTPTSATATTATPTGTWTQERLIT